MTFIFQFHVIISKFEWEEAFSTTEVSEVEKQFVFLQWRQEAEMWPVSSPFVKVLIQKNASIPLI